MAHFEYQEQQQEQQPQEITTKQQQQQQLISHTYYNENENNLNRKANDDWVDSVVEVASTCKKLFTRHTCRVCQVYVDRQVEYEQNEEQQVETRNVEDATAPSWLRNSILDSNSNNPSSLEVELYRQFLFDEDSVVEVMEEREKGTGDEES